MRGPKETRMSAGHTAVLSNKHENLRSRICQKPQGTEWIWQMESDWVQTIKAVHRKDCPERLHYRELFKEGFLVYSVDQMQIQMMQSSLRLWMSAVPSHFKTAVRNWKELFRILNVAVCKKMLPVNQSFILLCYINVILKSVLLWGCF